MRRIQLIALLMCSSIARAGVEPWADEQLKDRDGLLLWLDASRQIKAAEANGWRAPRPDVAIDALFDASGNRIHFAQLAGDARPVFVQPKEPANRPPSIRFDGKDDCLTATGAGGHGPIDKLTVLIVAAPRVAPGGFPGLLAATAAGQNDYSSGLNVDLGIWPSPRFDTVNVEGAGMTGLGNLFTGHPSVTGFPLGTFHTIAVTIADGAGGVALRVDGKPAGKRDRAAKSPMRIEQLVLGARLYSNEPPPPYLRSYFDGEIAEVLMYSRVLPADELGRVEKYLDEKYAGVRGPAAEVLPAGAHALVPVQNPPAVQMFVPGFSVRKLPLDLTNINNLRYRPDGKLVALAYDGNVYLLTDTDQDGLEDHVELFWDNKGRIQSAIGCALTPPNYPKGNGLFIAAKGKLTLVVDTDHDDKADKEIVVATGWPLPFHQVDALGVAIDPKDQAVYFGIGTGNFAGPYLIDAKDGKSHYDLKDERGTILRVSPDLSKREIVCTGIRFPVGMAFNPLGDLFCTDQEGATWVPNGNPFDELLHIQPGRHYGFPPRHPTYLPNVIDEPSTFDYGPQHQSTCGLTFNEPVDGGPVFGPASWRGDAIVTGYSRGKLYRTTLVKSALGYVAQNHLLADATMMLADATVTPSGDLVVAAHGGQPDWGSGPAGKGVLYKIVYTDRATPRPQPVVAYASGPREVRVAFDRPLDPQTLHGLAERTSIESGDAVTAGDRYESVRPGYDAVKRQLLLPRFGLDVLGAAVTGDRRTLVLQTAPMSAAAGYAICLKGTQSNTAHDATDLAYDLTGVEATWTPGDGKGAPQWTGWLPHFDLAVANAFTAGSAEHDALRALIKRPGVLRLRGQLNLVDMLRPSIQPGSKIDYEWPQEDVTVTINGGANVTAASPDPLVVEPGNGGPTRVRVTSPKQWLALDVSVATREGIAWPKLDISYSTNEDARPRPLPLRRVLLPWAKPAAKDANAAVATIEPPQAPELAGGNWARGRAVFHSEQAMCAKCHRLGEDGTGKIGPDLSNLHQRDYASVLKDVLFPDAAINPDHVAYAITLDDGAVLAGVPRSEGETLIVGEPGGQETRVARTKLKSMEPLATSIMPHGIDQTIGKEKLRDLMTFLLAPPLEPAKIEIPGAPPPPRTQAEVDAVLKRDTGFQPVRATKKETSSSPRQLKLLLAAGPKDHGIGEHDYPLWQKRWSQLLARADGVEIDTAFGWPEQKQFDSANVIVFFSNNPGYAADKAPQLDAYLKRGGGLVYLHYAVDGHDASDALAKSIGLAWRGGASKFRHGPLDLAFPDRAHPITRGFERVKFIDESYWQLIGDASKIHALATSIEDGAPQPILWTYEQPGISGRVFCNILGHYNWTFDDPLFRVLLLRGIAWCAHEDGDIDRLTPLATMGARIADTTANLPTTAPSAAPPSESTPAPPPTAP